MLKNSWYKKKYSRKNIETPAYILRDVILYHAETSLDDSDIRDVRAFSKMLDEFLGAIDDMEAKKKRSWWRRFFS